MGGRRLFLSTSPEDAARVGRDPGVLGRVAGSGVVELVERCPDVVRGRGVVVVGVDERLVVSRGGGVCAVDLSAGGVVVEQVVQAWDAGVQPDAQARWGAYLFDDGRVLRNFVGAGGPDELRVVEDRRVRARLVELAADPVRQTFDLEHLCAIHDRLFQDVYPWAGQTRTVDISKEGAGFSPWDEVGYVWEGIADAVRDPLRMRDMTVGDFAGLGASVYHVVNAAYAFREGNGRAQREWMSDFAREAGFEFAWTRVSGLVNDMASHRAREGDHTLMRAMFQKEDDEPGTGGVGGGWHGWGRWAGRAVGAERVRC